MDFCASTEKFYGSVGKEYSAFFEFCIRVHSLVYARLNFCKLGKAKDSFLFMELTFKDQSLNVKSTSSFNPSILGTVTCHDLLCNRLYKRHIIYGLVTIGMTVPKGSYHVIDAAAPYCMESRTVV